LSYFVLNSVSIEEIAVSSKERCMEKQPDTNESVRSKAIAQREKLEAKIAELRAEIDKHEFALRQIDLLIGPKSAPPSGKLQHESALAPVPTPARPPVRPPLQSRTPPAAKKKARGKQRNKKLSSKSDSGGQ
jgi:hypothetical protein